MAQLKTPVNWKREFDFSPGSVFLNHASFGPVTRRGRRAVDDLMRRRGRLDDPKVDEETFALIGETRRRFARLIHADSRRVAFAPNTSYGLNAVLWGLDLRRGDRILIPEVEFPAIVYIAQHIARLKHLVVDMLPCPEGYLSFETLDRALRRKKAAVLALSWVQYFNGYRYDLGALTELCHEQGCFVLVDAIQGVGAVPLDVRAAGIDALACGAQKWLFGQPGAGFFYIAPDPVRDVEPPYVGWLGVNWHRRFGDLKHHDRPRFADGRRWEIGTYPYISVRFAHSGLTMLADCGYKQVWETIQRALRRLTDGSARSRYRPLLFADLKNRSGIVSLRGPRIRHLFEHLKSRRVFVSLREGGIRVSPHFHTTDTEIDRFLDVLREFENR